MAAWIDHLAVAPILLPLAASALMLLFDERRRRAKLAVATLTTIALVAISMVLVGRAGSGAAIVYAIGGWPAPFGITLVVDRLSAIMLALASVLGLASLIYASARWDRAGPRFHALFLLQLMGLNGAFLTGDLFNLFVFFEVLLAASYGLLLHGSGRARVSAALHYVTINVATSLLFLVGASLIYGTTGTLNIADLAIRMPSVREADRMLLQSGLAILGVAFLIKAAMWPVGFWLPTTYSAASPPVAALFAILSKVGVYAVLRVLLLGRGGEAADPASIAGQWLQAGGMATILFGTIGVLASRTLSRLAGFGLIISSGILLATIAGGGPLAGALFYLVSSTLAVGALYLLIEPIARNEAEPNVAAATDPVFEDEVVHAPDDEGDEVGVVIPATLAILGGGFLMCALLLAGLPPLSGFLAKFAIIDGLLDAQPPVGWPRWTLIALIIVSGMATIIAASRAGIDLLWASERAPRTLRLAEAAPVGLMLALCLGLTVFAGPAYVYMEAAAQALPGAAGLPPGVAR